MPLVSVLVPVYNVEKYLPECLDSLVNQTLKDIEIICINDGSTDESLEILQRYASQDSRVRIIDKENTGYGHTMNVGLKNAKGDYIAIVESDDYASSNMLEKLYNYAVKYNTDIVKTSHYNNYYIEGKIVLSERLKGLPKGIVINSSQCPGLLHLADTIWSCLYRHSFLVEHGICFHETPGASFQDISFSLQCWLWAERVYLTDEAFLYYRRDNPNSSMHNPDKVFCVFDEYKWLEEKFRYFWKDHADLEPYFVATKQGDFLNHYYRIAPQFQYAFLLRFSEELKKDIEKGLLHEEAFELIKCKWEPVKSIAKDMKLFFLSSAKQLYDLRFELGQFANDIIYAEGFLERLAKYPRLIIYGAGKIAKMLAEQLIVRNADIKSFAVTDMSDNQKICMGYSVQELSLLVDLADSSMVVIATAEKAQIDIYQHLKKAGFKNICRVDKLLRDYLYSHQV